MGTTLPYIPNGASHTIKPLTSLRRLLLLVRYSVLLTKPVRRSVCRVGMVLAKKEEGRKKKKEERRRVSEL